MAELIIPAAAQCEIMETLSAKQKIGSDEIAAILKRHGVSGDAEALQTGYRKRLGQRIMSAIRDEQGQRELFSVGREYVIVECCNDAEKLKAIRRRLQRSMSGLDASSKKVRGRLHFLERFSPQNKGK